MSVGAHYRACKLIRKEFFELPGAVSIPCKFCGNPGKEHIYLTSKDLIRYELEDYDIKVCVRYDDETIICLVDPPPPEDPCDDDFMEEISS
jgi:hypothetical protein